jgi:hypothetical protein
MELCLKPVAATAVLVGITAMRKMGARTSGSKLRVRAAWCQTGLLALEARVAMLVFACPGVMPLEILGLCVCAALLFNLLCFFRTHRNGVNKTFGSYKARSDRKSESKSVVRRAKGTIPQARAWPPSV